MKFKLFACAAALAAMAVAGFGPASAAYPEKEVKLVIPFAPGGGTDLIFRLMSEKAEAALGKPIVGVNVAGAGGTKGSRLVREQPADGYTVLGGHEFLFTTYATGLVNYRWTDEFEPVALLTSTTMLIGVRAGTPYKNWKELAKFAHENPGKVVLSASPGSVTYVFFNELCRRSGISIRDFRIVVGNGSAAQVKAVLGGHVDVILAELPSTIDYIREGRIQAFGVSGDKRLPEVKDVPTLRELGINFDYTVNRALFVKKGTPKEAIDKLAAAYKVACGDASIKARFAPLGTAANFKGPEELRKYWLAIEPMHMEALKKPQAK